MRKKYISPQVEIFQYKPESGYAASASLPLNKDLLLIGEINGDNETEDFNAHDHWNETQTEDFWL